jgi:hypothetical protein
MASQRRWISARLACPASANLRRLGRAAEIDKDEILACDKQMRHILCDCCTKGNRKCLTVSLHAPALRVHFADIIGPCLL